MNFDKIKFYYFSGTGNTLLIVNKMKQVFETNGTAVKLFRIESAPSVGIEPNCAIGLGIPVAGQGTYPFIWDFIKALPKTSGTPIFLVDTLGAFSGGLLGPVLEIVQDKGYNPLGACEIIMPNNLFPFKNYSRENEIKITAGLKQSEEFAQDVLAGKSSWERMSLKAKLFSRISLTEITWKILRKLFKLKVDTAKCIKCGLCEKLCPIQNIEMKDYPRFKNKCVVCMRCISFCPERAISKGKGNYALYRAVSTEELLKNT
ncbi:MAG: EFR1 family ferrodoxin [Candidatus Omnitrophota bacterium]